MGGAALIAVLTCFIVNLAVDGKLSWLYIVVMGIGELWFLSVAVPGNFLTNWIVGEYEKPMDYFDTFVSNGLGNVVAAVVLLVIGIIISKRNNRHDIKE